MTLRTLQMLALYRGGIPNPEGVDEDTRHAKATAVSTDLAVGAIGLIFGGCSVFIGGLFCGVSDALALCGLVTVGVGAIGLVLNPSGRIILELDKKWAFLWPSKACEDRPRWLRKHADAASRFGTVNVCVANLQSCYLGRMHLIRVAWSSDGRVYAPKGNRPLSLAEIAHGFGRWLPGNADTPMWRRLSDLTQGNSVTRTLTRYATRKGSSLYASANSGKLVDDVRVDDVRHTELRPLRGGILLLPLDDLFVLENKGFGEAEEWVCIHKP